MDDNNGTQAPILTKRQLQDLDEDMKHVLDRFPRDEHNVFFYIRGYYGQDDIFQRKMGFKGTSNNFIQLMTDLLKKEPQFRVIFLGALLVYIHELKDLALIDKLIRMINLITEGTIQNREDIILNLKTA